MLLLRTTLLARLRRTPCAAAAALLVAGLAAAPASAQSTAVNGTIEGTVSDNTGAVLPGVTAP